MRRQLQTFDPREEYARSPEYAEVVATLNAGIDPSVHLPPPPTSEYATSLGRQMILCIRRAFLNKFRQPQQIRAFILMYIVMGLIIGSLYWQLDDTQLGARNRVALVYFSTIFAALGAFAAVPGVVLSRATYYREKPSFLRPFAFFVAQSLSEVPFTCIATWCYSVVIYFMAGLNLADYGLRVVLFAFVYSFASVLAVAFAQMVAVLSPSQESASTTVGVSLSILSLFAGFIIPKLSIEWYWRWLHYLSIFKYPLEALSINEMLGETFGCPDGQGALSVATSNYTFVVRTQSKLSTLIDTRARTLGTTEVQSTNTRLLVRSFQPYCPISSGTQFIAMQFDMNQDWKHFWMDVGAMGILYTFMLIVTYIGVRFVNHMRR